MKLRLRFNIKINPKAIEGKRKNNRFSESGLPRTFLTGKYRAIYCCGISIHRRLLCQERFSSCLSSYMRPYKDSSLTITK